MLLPERWVAVTGGSSASLGRAIGGRDVRWREKPGPRDPGAVGGVPVFGAHRLIGGPQDNSASQTMRYNGRPPGLGDANRLTASEGHAAVPTAQQGRFRDSQPVTIT